MFRRLLSAAGPLNNLVATAKDRFLPNSKLILGGARTSIKRTRNYVSSKDPEGIKYHGFTYFPRFPNQVDPPYAPSKLFRVTLVMPTFGTPYWEKDVLKQLGLYRTKVQQRREQGTRGIKEAQAHGYKYKIAIVANTPFTCALLYRVKHLIEIQPISFPHGVPTDPSQGFLKENGEYVSYNLLESPGMDVSAGEKDVIDLRTREVDKHTLRQRLKANFKHKY